MSWKGESRRHSLARKGVKTNIDGGRRFDVSNFVAKGEDRPKVKFMGEGRSMHGYIDRSWDEYLFEEEDGTNIEVVVFSEPDWDMLREVGEEEEIKEQDWDEFVLDREEEFYQEGNGEVHVIWAGALDFTGTENEFAGRYPELNEYLNLGDLSGTWVVEDMPHELKYHAEKMPQGHYKVVAEDKSGRYRIGYTSDPEAMIRETAKGYDIRKVR